MLGTCSFDGCEKEAKLTRGFCPTHYMRWLRRGDPSIVLPPGTPGNKRKHRMYGAWAAMINRCHNPNNSSYGRYGAKGVYVCDRWRANFLNFLADMGERPEGMTLDRFPDPTGPYSPENCRWATIREQRANISEAGDQRMRKAMSNGVKERWRRWRADRAASVLE